jgi:hypothetical protein
MVFVHHTKGQIRTRTRGGVPGTAGKYQLERRGDVALLPPSRSHVFALFSLLQPVSNKPCWLAPYRLARSCPLSVTLSRFLDLHSLPLCWLARSRSGCFVVLRELPKTNSRTPRELHAAVSHTLLTRFLSNRSRTLLLV